MSIRVAFDLDGVFADMHSALQREALQLFAPADAALAASALEHAVTEPSGSGTIEPTSAEPAGGNTLESLTSAQEKRLWGHIRQMANFWDGLKEIEPGSVKRLATLATKNRWEVLFITNRPDTVGDTAQRQSQRWLERNGFALPSVFVVRGSRGKIAAALDLDVVVDDTPQNCLDVVIDSAARAVLVWRLDDDVPEQARRLNIGRVATTMACLTLLEQADQPADRGDRLVDRLRALLGLQARPARDVTWEDE